MEFTTAAGYCAHCGKQTPAPDPERPFVFCGLFCADKMGYRVQYEYDQDGEPLRESKLIPASQDVPPYQDPLPQKSRHFPLLLDKPPAPTTVDDSPLAGDGSISFPEESSSAGPTVLPYTGDIAQDAAWRAAGERYDSKANSLLSHSDMIVLAGYDAGLAVQRKALVVREGHTHSPQELKIHTLQRGQHRIRRIIFAGATGSVSLPAVAWCRQQGISILILGYDGSVESAIGANAPADARLRRAQYLAATNGRDVAIARAILKRKIAGQLRTLEAHPDLQPSGGWALDMLKAASASFALKKPLPWESTAPGLRLYEAKLSALYFGTMDDLPLRWLKADRKRIPPHWLIAGPRSSLLSKNARHAANPFHCLLNYAYGALEGGCRLALSSIGFDISLGFLHTADSKTARDSLVYDLMELDRPSVDGLVIDVITKWTLHYGDFTRVKDGSVKLHPQLCRAVVAACRVEQMVLDRHAAWLGRLVVEGGTDGQ